MPDQPRQSISEIIENIHEGRRQLDRAHGEIETAIGISRDTLAQSVELLAKVSDVLVRRGF